MFSVKDGRRTLTFDGDLLAESTSQRRGGARWVEFKLYRTDGGKYVLSRIGQSLVYHGPICSTLDRSDSLEPSRPVRGGVPCEFCEPEYPGVVLPEKAREWAQVMDAPEAVLETLYRYDDHGARFLTRVARNLIESAAERDGELHEAYYTEHVA